MPLTTAQTHSRTTRWLHLLIALAIVAQMIMSLIEEPRLDPPENFWFEVHEKVGLASLALLFVFWIWAVLRRREEGLGHFFPWFSASRLRELSRDLRAHAALFRTGELPISADQPLAGAVHGLGLIVATILAVTGTVGYFFASVPYMLGIHEAMVWPMWIYLIGHAAMAIVHEFKGDGVIRAMFSLKQ